MADISKIKPSNGTVYNIKDTTARNGLTDRPTSFVGTRSEWNALPVATQVKYSLVHLKGEGVYKNNGTGLELIADAGMPETYPAEQVMLSDGVTSVEDALSTKSNSNDIALNFSESRDYIKGSLTWYNNNLYEFTSDHAAGAWNDSHVILTTVSSSINRRNKSQTLHEVTRVTADGVKSYSQLLDSIYLARGTHYVLEVNGIKLYCGGTSITFGGVHLNSAYNTVIRSVLLKASGSVYRNVTINGSTSEVVASDMSSVVPTQGSVIRLLEYSAI